MKKEIRQKIVDYEVFISNDGTEFDNEKDAIYHDKILNAEIKECHICHGRGYIFIEIEDEDYHSGSPITIRDSCKCDRCKGKGYLEKKIIWE